MAFQKNDRVKVKQEFQKNYPNWQDVIHGIFIVEHYRNNVGDEKQLSCWADNPNDKGLYTLLEPHLILA